MVSGGAREFVLFACPEGRFKDSTPRFLKLHCGAGDARAPGRLQSRPSIRTIQQKEAPAAMARIDIEWLQATLQDASDALTDTIAALNESPDEETAAELLRRDLVEVYAKLNYAVNTAELGPNALNELTEDELIAWPLGMPFLAWSEEENIDDDEDDEADENDFEEDPETPVEAEEEAEKAEVKKEEAK